MGCIGVGSYGAALLSLACKENLLKEFKEQMIEVDEAVKLSQDLMKYMEYPWISKPDKKELLDKIFDCHTYIMNLMYLLVDKSKFSCINDVCRDFIADANEMLNIEIAELTSAYALNEEELDAIRRLLEKKTNKTIQLKQVIDSSCIAGIKLKLKDMVMENTAAGRLNAIKQLAAKADIQNKRGESNEAEA